MSDLVPIPIYYSSVVTYNGETLVDYDVDISGAATAADDEDLDWGAVWSGQDKENVSSGDVSSQQQDSAAKPLKQNSAPAIPSKRVQTAAPASSAQDEPEKKKKKNQEPEQKNLLSFVKVTKPSSSSSTKKS